MVVWREEAKGASMRTSSHRRRGAKEASRRGYCHQRKRKEIKQEQLNSGKLLARHDDEFFAADSCSKLSASQPFEAHLQRRPSLHLFPFSLDCPSAHRTPSHTLRYQLPSRPRSNLMGIFSTTLQPSGSLRPFDPPLGVDLSFCMPVETVLILREKLSSWSGDDFEIKDSQGTVALLCSGSARSILSNKKGE